MLMIEDGWGRSDLSIKEFFVVCLNPHVFDICLSYNTINDDDVIGSGGCGYDISIWIFQAFIPINAT
jgi:hypothetical protein